MNASESRYSKSIGSKSDLLYFSFVLTFRRKIPEIRFGQCLADNDKSTTFAP